MAGKDNPSQRRRFLATELRKLGSDCAIITHPKHIFYLTGVPTNLNMWFSLMKGPRLTSALTVDREGAACMIVGRTEMAGLREAYPGLEHPDFRLEEYDDYSLSSHMVVYADLLASHIKKWLRSLNIRLGSVAVEEWHLPEVYRGAISATEPSAHFTGISEFLLRMRASKGRDEIESIEKATKIVDRSYSAAKVEAKAGRTEAQMYGSVNAWSFSEHGPFSWVVGDYASGSRSLNIGGMPTHRKMKNGETIILDLQAAENNYWSDLCRTFVVGGRPSPAQTRALSVLKEAKAAAEDLLVPGTKGKEVYEKVCEVLVKAGYPKLPHHAGHGIGLDDQEPPWFIPGEERRLEEGSVCVVEPGVYRKDSGGIRIEDQYVVREGGPKKLSSFPLSF